jgi:hypothetical protein
MANAMVPEDAVEHHGGAIFANAATVTIYTSTFVANYARDGSCICGVFTAIIMIFASNFKSNGSPDAAQGGAITLGFGAAIKMYDSTFAENLVGSSSPVSVASCSLCYHPLVILARPFVRLGVLYMPILMSALSYTLSCFCATR